jgi:hypothetical protein
MNDKELHQYDLDLCKDSTCWRFEQDAPKCNNCPYLITAKAQLQAIKSLLEGK